MYSIRKLKMFDLYRLKKVSDILYDCGKDMARTSDLHHWDNSYFKNWGIVILCLYKNDLYLVYDGAEPVATFQTRKDGQSMTFQKLATVPSFSCVGIGSYCLAEIENIAKKDGCSE